MPCPIERLAELETYTPVRTGAGRCGQVRAGAGADGCGRVPAGADLGALVLHCLRASPVPIFHVPDEVVGRYALVEATEEEYEDFARHPEG